jgi:hypothetical protein
MDGGAAWNLSSKGGAKKRKPQEKVRRSKKRKLERLVGWGEMEEEGEGVETVMEDWLVTNTEKEPKSDAMKQMEISFMEILTKKVPEKKVEAGTNSKRMSKEEKLEIAAKGSRKVTDWIIRTPGPDREWDDDPDLPELEEIDAIEAREAEKDEVLRQAMETMAMEMVMELVTSVEATSVAGNIMSVIVEEAWKRVEIEDTWRRIEDDPEIERMILERIRKKEEAKVVGMEKEKERREADSSEAWILNTEQKVLEEAVGVRDDILDAKMKTYLEDTNLHSKRMVGATNWVEPYQPKSGLNVGNMSMCLGYKDNILSQDNETQEDIFVSKDICMSTRVIISTGSESSKRKLGDDGDWWLPSGWKMTRSSRGPGSSTTGTGPPSPPRSSWGRWCGWRDVPEPGEIEKLNKEHEKHKQFWSKLDLTSEVELGVQVVQPVHPGGREHDGHDGALLGGRGGSALCREPGTSATGDGGVCGGGPGGSHQHHQGDVPRSHGMSQNSTRIFAGRKYRLKDGASRDRRKQLGIRNFTVLVGQNSVGGGILDRKGEGSEGVTGQERGQPGVAGLEME